MIFFRKYFFKIIVSVLIVAFLLIAPFPLFNKINALNYSFNSEYQLNYSGVLELWNVDTFEGGSVSRTAFLEKRAQEFEKQNKGVFIQVKNITLEQLENNLKNNKKPNIITYGMGAGELILNYILNLNSSFNVRQDLLNSCKVNGKLKALPIILGGYTIISNKEKINNENLNEILKNQIVFSSNEYNCPLLSLFVNNINYNLVDDFNLDSFSAYEKFINNNFNVLLGTQRDYYRCKNRENNGKMSCFYNIMGGYSDLIQYCSIFENEHTITEICEKFLEYLVSDECQEKLININMFPVINKNIYSEEDYKNYNEILLKPLSSINVFLKNSEIKNLQQLLKDYFKGETKNKQEILNYLKG